MSLIADKKKKKKKNGDVLFLPIKLSYIPLTHNWTECLRTTKTQLFYLTKRPLSVIVSRKFNDWTVLRYFVSASRDSVSSNIELISNLSKSRHSVNFYRHDFFFVFYKRTSFLSSSLSFAMSIDFTDIIRLF